MVWTRSSRRDAGQSSRAQGRLIGGSWRRALQGTACCPLLLRGWGRTPCWSPPQRGGRGGDCEGGKSEAMSLSALVLVELIHVQAASGGDVREGTVRALLPLVLSACGRGSPGAIRGKGIVGHTHWRWTTGLHREVRMIVYLLQYCSTLLCQSHTPCRIPDCHVQEPRHRYPSNQCQKHHLPPLWCRSCKD